MSHNHVLCLRLRPTLAQMLALTLVHGPALRPALGREPVQQPAQEQCNCSGLGAGRFSVSLRIHASNRLVLMHSRSFSRLSQDIVCYLRESVLLSRNLCDPIMKEISGHRFLGSTGPWFGWRPGHSNDQANHNQGYHFLFKGLSLARTGRYYLFFLIGRPVQGHDMALDKEMIVAADWTCGPSFS